MYTLILTLVTESSTEVKTVEGFETEQLAIAAGETWLEVTKYLRNAHTSVVVARTATRRPFRGPK